MTSILKYLNRALLVLLLAAFAACSDNEGGNESNGNGDDGNTETPADGDTYGYIKDTNGNPVEGVVVSDGYSCTATDAEGRYALTRNADAGFVFYSLPPLLRPAPSRNGALRLHARSARRTRKAVRPDLHRRSPDQRGVACRAFQGGGRKRDPRICGLGRRSLLRHHAGRPRQQQMDAVHQHGRRPATGADGSARLRHDRKPRPRIPDGRRKGGTGEIRELFRAGRLLVQPRRRTRGLDGQRHPQLQGQRRLRRRIHRRTVRVAQTGSEFRAEGQDGDPLRTYSVPRRLGHEQRARRCGQILRRGAGSAVAVRICGDHVGPHPLEHQLHPPKERQGDLRACHGHHMRRMVAFDRLHRGYAHRIRPLPDRRQPHGGVGLPFGSSRRTAPPTPSSAVPNTVSNRRAPTRS